jgi:hypothetical protein
VPDDSYHFPSVAPIWGFNAYAQLPDIIDRGYIENQDASVATVTPSDTDVLPFVVTQLYVKTAGDVKVMLDDQVTIVTLPALTVGVGHSFPFRIAQIFATGTTATGIIGIAG